MTDELLTVMRGRLADAEEDARRLRDAIAILERGEGTPPVAPRRRSPAPAPEPRAVVPLGRLLRTLREVPGQTATRLARDTGGDQAAILGLLKEAEAQGTVRREGQRRATAWFLITDEDRVAAKAAEIEARLAPRDTVTRSPE